MNHNEPEVNREKIVKEHRNYLERFNYKGWDVFDGLNSTLIQKSGLSNNRLFRLLWIQFFKRSPINFRQITGVPKEYNPKGLALFISGLVSLYYVDKDQSILDRAKFLYDELSCLKSDTATGLAWGYNFDWQARAFYVPKFKPNMICTVFAGNAILDLYKIEQDETLLEQAVEIGKFILNDLILQKLENSICFAYIPGENAVVHNANLMGARFLSRLYSMTSHVGYKNYAEQSVRFSTNHQSSDGAWEYGTRGHHRWVDNFHTGYNLVAMYDYQENCNDDQFSEVIEKGIAYHLKHHFTDTMIPKYTDAALYPIDIHCYAQAILTFIKLRDLIPDYRTKLPQLVDNVIRDFWDEKRHYFYYQKHKWYTNKIPYIRWSQAWMFYALTTYLREYDGKEEN